MGEPGATASLLAGGLIADTASTISQFVGTFIYVYILLVFAYIITSWIRLPYRPWLGRVQRFLYDVCDPYLRIIRRFVPPLGPLDLSPMIGIVLLIVLRQVLTGLIEALL
jgi:YggT family protein